ncbi:MAG TPA: LysR family transcriptional regulator [Myxococcota bacterium]|nr:LysR family transcriptional regulator [Myxococcota bacterium]
MIRASLDGFEALDAIERHGSFAAAAAALHKAQSAVSYAVRQLEGALGLTLFDRAGHRARLTPEGVIVLAEARAVLARVRGVEALAGQLASGWEPRLTVVVDGVLPMRPVMLALQALEREGVPTHVQITTEFLRGVQRRFDRDDADLMIVKDWDRAGGLEARPLPPEEMVLTAAPDHPVHASGPHDSASLRSFLELSVHDSSDETRGRDTNTGGGGRVFYVSDFGTKLDGLRMGLGWGWLPLRMARDDIGRGALREVAHRTSSRWVFTPELVVRRDRPLGRTGRLLIEHVLAAWEAA